MVEVFDNFLSEEEHKKIEETMLGWEFPWYFQSNGRDYTGDGKWQFTYRFAEDNKLFTSDWVWIIVPFLEKLKVREVGRIKANLQPAMDNPSMCEYHVDYTDEDKWTTAVYYVTGGGFTEIKDDKKYESVPNRLIKFPVQTPHRKYESTDHRIVINFNYIS
jgi:hypothetical protein